MQPIFKEQIKMWSDLGYPLPITEGKYWYDNHFVCAFTPDGRLHKLYKYKVFDNLSIEIKPYAKAPKGWQDCHFETWSETAERERERMQTVVQSANQKVKNALKQFPNHKKALFNSTGKDSMVTLDIVQKSLPDIKVYFNNTSIDVADTYKMVKAHDWTILNPDIGFYQYCKENHFIPTRFSRGCCTEFKEGKSIEHFKDEPQMLFFMGVRNDESNARADREDISHNPKWGNRDWYSSLPIREFSELDVWLYILHNNLEINPKYRKGYSRVGCSVCCPYYTKYTWVLDKYWFPIQYKRWRDFLRKDFAQEQRWTKLNCTTNEYTNEAWCGGLYRPEPTDEVINEFMTYKGIDDRSVAQQYFNKTCAECGKNIRQYDVVGMNLKLRNRLTDNLYCKKHLQAALGITNEQWKDMIEEFKIQGCNLF